MQLAHAGRKGSTYKPGAGNGEPFRWEQVTRSR